MPYVITDKLQAVGRYTILKSADPNGFNWRPTKIASCEVAATSATKV
jgi:hypothetical protein